MIIACNSATSNDVVLVFSEQKIELVGDACDGTLESYSLDNFEVVRELTKYIKIF